ncbi:hybrid sensor histidine kinase/response regulator [Luteimonas aquatica]|uniref:hybrid sensor histidine kinase/response regulator n=1 Tax=Luteimonas aquatica TaxID=450364 RepID=UPI001F562A9C|nr:ATP-binding protein [Luteimonas aquatica]
MKLRVATGVLLLVLATIGQVWAAMPETPRFRRFGPEQGLPWPTWSIALDRQGYLWIATGDGLARYDGVNFKLWRHRISQTGSLPENGTVTVTVDGFDRVWVATCNSLSWLGRDRETFMRTSLSFTDSACAIKGMPMAATPDGAMWIGTTNGDLQRVDVSGAVQRIRTGQGVGARLPGGAITALLVDGKGRLLVGTSKGLARYENGSFRRVGADLLAGVRVGALSKEANGTVWIGSDRGLYRLGGGDEVRPSPWTLPPGATDAQVLRDRNGGYWIGTDEGLYRVDGTGRTQLLSGDLGDGIWDRASSVLEMRQDIEGGIWFTTSSQGLIYLPPGWNRFASITFAGGVPLEKLDVRDLAPDGEGGFWVASIYDLYRLERGSRELRHVASRRELGVDVINSIYHRKDGKLWVCHTRGLSVYDPDRRSVASWPAAGPRPDGSLWYLFQEADGTLWLSFSDGTTRRYSPDGKPIPSGELEQRIGSQGVIETSFAQTSDGALWFADSSGIYRRENGRFVPVQGGNLPGIRVFRFGAPDRMWVVRTGAVENFRVREGKLQLEHRFSHADGLPDAEVGDLLVSDRGTAWLASARGLWLYSPEHASMRAFGTESGLSDPNLMLTIMQPGADSTAAVLANNGLALFDTRMPMPKTDPPRLSLESVSVRREEDEWPLDPASSLIELLPDDRDLRIVARLLSFVDPRSHVYRFKLDGYDPDWILQPGNGERVFSHLEPGQYRLLVQAAGADGIWSRPRSFALDVPYPWWRTSWAYLAYGLALLLAFWILARLYQRRLRRRSDWQLHQKKRELAEQASEAKTRFLATLGHEVRTPMTGVLGMSELLLATDLDARQRGYTESIRRAGDHLMRLVNDALDLARIEAGRLDLDPQPVELRAMLEDVIGLMAPMARQRGLAFHTAIAPDVPAWVRGDSGRLRQILLNLLGNAIKFTERGEVALRAETTAQGVRFVVSDTGPGMSEEQRGRLFRRFEQAEGVRTASRYGGSGLGLAICQELAAAMGGGIEVESTLGQGTRFAVELPLAAVAAPAAPSGQAPAGEGERTCERCDLLLVEDDPTIAQVMAELLRAQGHRVVHVAHGLAALTEVASRRFDLALLDLDLPGIDGLALAQQLRAQGFAQPMIAVTARADADAEPAARAAGFDDFLRKPVTGGMLAEAIDAALSRPRG